MKSPFFEKTIPVGPLMCNCHLLVCPKTHEACLIDPGDEPARILKMIEKAENELGKKITLKYLLHTHGHFDHIGATRDLSLQPSLANSQPLRTLHKGDLPLYENLPEQGKRYGMQFMETLPIQKFIEDDEELWVGEQKLKVIHNPGHSPGSCSFVASHCVFTGDTLFQGDIGRTDLWGGDEPLMLKKIKTRLLTLEGELEVRPGHGGNSTIGHEKFNNPYLI